jgi:hypothetical protein
MDKPKKMYREFPISLNDSFSPKRVETGKIPQNRQKCDNLFIYRKKNRDDCSTENP